MAYTLELAKERFKFSSTHFTIFSETRAEALHGHNYKVSTIISFKDADPDTGLTQEFSKLKDHIYEVCNSLDEKILLPSDSPFLDLGESEGNVEVRFNNKFYSFPAEDCKVLNIVNTSSECLSAWLHQEISQNLNDIELTKLEVCLQETSGQSVTYSPETP